MLNDAKLAIKFLWREWRAGEWYIVFFSLVLAIAATTSIHFYTDRLARGLDLQAARFLGGDLVVTSSNEILAEWIKQAKAIGLKTAEVWAYPSVVTANNNLQLVNVQAVSSSYPIVEKNVVKLAPNSMWVDLRLMSLLGIQLKDSIMLGAANFTVQKILVSDLDVLNTGFAIAPRVMVRIADIPATRTVIAGSRVDYRLLLVGNEEQLQQFKQWLAPKLKLGQTLLDIHSQQSTLRTVLFRVDVYLELILLFCLLMGGVAITLSIQSYLQRHRANVALWRCFGAKQGQIVRIGVWQLSIIATLAGSLAVVIGYFAQAIFANLFESYLQFDLPSVGIKPVYFGLLTSLAILFMFALPVIIALPQVSPLFIWRGTAMPKKKNHVLLIVLLLMALFIYGIFGDSLTVLRYLLGLMIIIGILYAVSIYLIKLIRILLINTEGVMRRGLSQLVQHSDSVSFQFVGFSLIFIAVITLGLIRSDIIQQWQQSLPKTTPNYFVFNIAPTDVTAVEEFFQRHNVLIDAIYPMVRGRLVEKNDQPILAVIPPTAVNNNALHRELNLSWMWMFPTDNKIVQGPAWPTQQQDMPLVSVENELAQNLHLQLGDKLTFQVGDRRVSATISNFRTLDWSSFHPNFFMIFSPGVLDKFPATYITSIYLGKNQIPLLKDLVQQFPNIAIIDVANVLLEMQTLLGKMTLALQYLFFFALGIGVLIFIASLQASMDERRKTYRLLHILGATRSYIRQSILVEFTMLAVMIAVSSVLLSYVIAYVIGSYFFGT
jgi:putative ABC transport system permease protein